MLFESEYEYEAGLGFPGCGVWYVGVECAAAFEEETGRVWWRSFVENESTEGGIEFVIFCRGVELSFSEFKLLLTFLCIKVEGSLKCRLGVFNGKIGGFDNV